MEMPELVMLVRRIAEYDQEEVNVRFYKHGTPKAGIAILRNRNVTSTRSHQYIGAAIQCREYQVVYVLQSDNQKSEARTTSLD